MNNKKLVLMRMTCEKYTRHLTHWIAGMHGQDTNSEHVSCVLVCFHIEMDVKHFRSDFLP